MLRARGHPRGTASARPALVSGLSHQDTLYDVVIIGRGPGGTPPGVPPQLGLSVALVEKDPTVGGTCLLRGCIPAKRWLPPADVFTTVREAGSFGVNAGEPTLTGVPRSPGPKSSPGWCEVSPVCSRHARSRSTRVRTARRPGRVTVSGDEGERVLEGRNVIVATGSAPRSIPGYPFDGKHIVTRTMPSIGTANPNGSASSGRKPSVANSPVSWWISAVSCTCSS